MKNQAELDSRVAEARQDTCSGDSSDTRSRCVASGRLKWAIITCLVLGLGDAIVAS